MATTVRERPIVFTARKPTHSAQIAFYIAHELGHIALGHVKDGSAIIEALAFDAEETDDGVPVDVEEAAADEFAFELLTGNPKFTVDGPLTRGTADELAKTALQAGGQLQVDPGFLVLCFGRTTGRWPVAVAALKELKDQAGSVPRLINAALRGQLDMDLLSFDDQAYIDAVVAT